MDAFRVRLNCIDHYQGTPTKYDARLRNDVRTSQFSKEPKVPLIRIFGSTETGQKVCAHVHGAFPYMFIEYSGGLEQEEVGAYITRLHLSIDHALAVSYRRDVYGADHPKYVARVTLVKGIPFYGFHVGYRFFLKIYTFNPVVMGRLADLLQQGVIMNRKFQPYEAHMQYLLQFMADYNLYGCDYLETSKVRFRSPVPKHEEDPDSSHLWHSQTIPDDQITDDFRLPRVSHCSIEVDICVQDISNRAAVKERRLHHDFIEKAKPIPIDKKLVPSMAGLWKDETKRRKRRMRSVDPGSSPFPPEVLVSMSADPRDSQPQGWIHEDEYRQQIQELIEIENARAENSTIDFETFVKQDSLESGVRTILESLEDLYPQNLLPVLGLSQNPAGLELNPTSSIVVDEKGILEKPLDEDEYDDLFPDDSDEDAIQEAIFAAQAEQELAIKNEESVKPKSNASAANEPRQTNEQQRHNTNLPLSLNNEDCRPSSLTNSVAAGVWRSGLRGGDPPVIPLDPGLLEVAKTEGLVSSMAGSHPTVNRAVSHAKRPRSPDLAASQLKRQKLVGIQSRTDSTSLPPTSSQERVVVRNKNKGSSTYTASSQPKELTSSQEASKTSTNRTLSFAVVKDPFDPSTILRLSQQSSSQRSEENVAKKQVTFDPLLPLAEAHSSTSGEAVRPTPPLSGGSLGSSHARKQLSSSLASNSSSGMIVLEVLPPSTAEVVATMQNYNLPDVIPQDAFYGNEKDVPPRTREYAGREFRLLGNTLPFLPEFDATGESPQTFGMKLDVALDNSKSELQYRILRRQCTLRSWEIAQPPPSFDEVVTWWQEKKTKAKVTTSSDAKPPIATQAEKAYMSQIDGPTPKNKHGFKYTQRANSTSVQHEAQYMSTMSLEIHVNARGNLVPNPEEDEVQSIFWCIKSDGNTRSPSQSADTSQSGIIVMSEDGSMAQRFRNQASVEVLEESSELDLMVRMVEVVRSHDPDILTGYEVHGSSWGYLIERARFKYDYNLCDEFSRMKSDSHGRAGKDADRWGFNTTSTIRVTGRHMINVWRAMRGELNLLQYTMENVAWHLLHRRIPHYSWRTLTEWYNNGRHRDLAKLIRYYQTRTRFDIEILEENELIPRTSEQARLLGVDFFSVFSRGSQFKVESIMFRIAKPENFVLPSPSRKQVGGQNALECLPLVMEPQSAFYSSPLLVLDFQSLYPSVMIAYNYCYSTFLGRIVSWRGMNKMGFSEYKRQDRLLGLLKDHINIAPNGMMYVKGNIRKSLLAKMLTEILETRVMVKSGMKQDKDDKTLQALLNNRQLALKLLANVTYGYTSASFSGRMPCSEIADSIVQTARETLERAIAYIHSVERWGAEVVYGDTDSLFIYLKGRTKDQAFDIGNEIAKEITDMNPRPVKLKFEKVYHPCVLLAKKRYVGYKYESKDQLKPEFDAKGIETVRRDGTPAEQKIEEKALKLLFETADLSQVKSYFQKQCEKIMRGAVSIQDFCFAKEVRLGTYSDKAPPPPGALISTRRMLADARAEPQYGERVPYVVTTGAPGARLIDRCVAPEDLLASAHAQLDAEYYISKNIIPPLERIFNLVGANVRQWYDEMPKVQRVRRVDTTTSKKFTLESYLRSASCVVCSVKMKGDGAICGRCSRNVPASLEALQGRLGREERVYMDVLRVCQSCAALAPLDDVPCDSKDCPVFYTRMKQAARLRTERAVVQPVVKMLAQKGVAMADLEW